MSAGSVPNVACPSQERGTTNRGKGPAVLCAGVRHAVALHSLRQRLSRVTTACDRCALSPSSIIEAKRASDDSLQKGNILAV